MVSGPTVHGLIGVGYDSMSSIKEEPKSVLTSMVNSGVIPYDMVSFRGCPATSQTQVCFYPDIEHLTEVSIGIC